MQDVKWYVIKYPSKEANEGKVLWDEGYATQAVAERQAKALQLGDSVSDYEVSDLPELMKVHTRDVLPVLEAEHATKH